MEVEEGIRGINGNGKYNKNEMLKKEGRAWDP